MISFTVFGTPIPQGSTKAFIPKGWTRAVITTDNKKLKPWRQQVSQAAMAALADAQGEMIPRGSPVQVVVHFFFAKPKSAKKATMEKTTKPDLDKLERALYDSLTGILFEDDSQIVLSCAQKAFGLPERTEIRVSVKEPPSL
jgi:Holliday junction resolvase RusA-like endonuclease